MIKWCNYYDCLCDEAEDTTEGMGDCDYACDECSFREEVKSR